MMLRDKPLGFALGSARRDRGHRDAVPPERQPVVPRAQAADKNQLVRGRRGLGFEKFLLGVTHAVGLG